MATRGRYKRGGAITIDEPITEPAASADVTPQPAPPIRKEPELPPSDPAEHDAVKRAVEAARIADEYQRQRNPQTLIDQIPGLSDHKRVLEAKPASPQ